jgi:hypothetical protein
MSGFDFSNHIRNNHLGKNVMVPGARSTGTTIVGCLFDGGIVLGADTRATEGPIVADKNCEKVSCQHGQGNCLFRLGGAMPSPGAGLTRIPCLTSLTGC